MAQLISKLTFIKEILKYLLHRTVLSDVSKFAKNNYKVNSTHFV